MAARYACDKCDKPCKGDGHQEVLVFPSSGLRFNVEPRYTIWEEKSGWRHARLCLLCQRALLQSFVSQVAWEIGAEEKG